MKNKFHLINSVRSTQGFQILRNDRGITTTDFLFSMMFSFSLILVTLALTFTLSMMEITQYITYSAARAMAAAQETPEIQTAKAKSKFDSLSKVNPAFKNLYAGSWFALSAPEIRSGSPTGAGSKNFAADYDPGDANYTVQHGVRVTLTSKVLEINIPFVGSLAPEDGGFSARLISMLLRESSFQECRTWMTERFNKLQQDQKLQPSGGSSPPVAWEDNGC